MSGLNIVAAEVGREKYIIVYDDEHRTEAMRQCGKWASNKELSFTWMTAAQCSMKIRETTERCLGK